MDEGLLELSELTLALCISSLMELACDELLEPVPERLWLSCCNSLAPGELLEMEASSVRAELATPEAPASIACTIALISSFDSPGPAEVEEAAGVRAEEAAFRAVESSESRSC